MFNLTGYFAANAPCVMCGKTAGTAFRGEGLPGAPLLPLHIRCGMLLIIAAREYVNTGDDAKVPESLREPFKALGPGGSS